MKNQKGISSLIIVIIIVIIIGIIAVGGVLGYEYYAEESKKEADLSSSQLAYLFCMNAFREGDQNNLEHCLSKENLRRFNRDRESYIKLWQGSLSSCGGYDREIIEVLNYHKSYPEEHNEDKAYIYFNPVSGCQDWLQMIREDGKWKFNET